METFNKIYDKLFVQPIPPLPENMGITYTAIILMAIIPIYIGSFRSVGQIGAEKMSSKDAWMFPLVGSAVLFGLYILFKIFSKEYINLLLTIYFISFAVFALASTISPYLKYFAPKSLEKKKPWKFSFSLPFFSEPFKFEITVFDIIAFIISAAHSAWYLSGKNWIANNIFGLAFSIQAISLLFLGSFKVASILLGGLFIYDIFWVFFTDVMVTVAKSFDAPIKVLFPKDIFAAEYQFSMLGLGDIVIPGVFVALMLRFDIHMSHQKKSNSRLYFYVSYIAYTLGLINTIFVMHTFQAAQPALLYLVPWCLGSVFLTALVRSQLKDLFAYSDETEEEKSAGEKKTK